MCSPSNWSWPDLVLTSLVLSYRRQLIVFGAETDAQLHLQKVFWQSLQPVVVQGQVLHLVVVVLGHLQQAECVIVQLKYTKWDNF